MRSVDDFREYAAASWPRRFPRWLVDPLASLSWPLHPPSHREALADPNAVAAWATKWRVFEDTTGVDVAWVERAWPGSGRQRLPAKVTATREAVAGIAGAGEAWGRGNDVVELLRRTWPDADLEDAIVGTARRLSRLEPLEHPRLATVLAWLEAHPDSGVWERELPVLGIDSKWFERNRSIVEAFSKAITGRSSGLRRRGVGFRVRSLDPELAGGIDATLTLEGLTALDVAPRRVLISENLTPVSALPPMAGTLAVHGMGFAAVSLSDVSWVMNAAVLYWGDLDTYGFRILGQVRQALTQTESVLMDGETLRSARAFAVTEPRPYRGPVGHLNLAELETLASLRSGNLRLEQERIPAAVVARALQEL